jgi:hypothetical protein
VSRSFQKYLSLAILVLALGSALCLVPLSGAFASTDPFALVSSAWTIFLVFIAYRAVIRMRRPIAAASNRLPIIIFTFHSAVVAAWLAWAFYQESKQALAGWGATLYLHYLLEAPTTAVCAVGEIAFQAIFRREFSAVWIYLVYFTVGGAFYAALPWLLSSRTPKPIERSA